MQIYAKIWTYLHINVKFNKYVKYEQVAYRAPDHTTAVWSGLNMQFRICFIYMRKMP